MPSLFQLLDQQVDALEPKSKAKKQKFVPEENHTLDDIIPRSIVSPDQGKTRYVVKRQMKESIGDRLTPKRTWVKSLILLNLTGSGERVVSMNQWQQDGWIKLDFSF